MTSFFLVPQVVSDAAGRGVTITGTKPFNNWNWPNAVIFAATVITTIGASSSSSNSSNSDSRISTSSSSNSNTSYSSSNINNSNSNSSNLVQILTLFL